MFDPAILNFFSNLTSGTLYFLFGSILTGIFTWKIVVPRIMKNKDIQELKQFIMDIRDELTDELKETRKNRGTNAEYATR